MQLSSRLIIILCVFFAGVTACSTSGVSVSGSSGSCDNPLYPVKQGATWTYSSTGGPAGSFTYTDTITQVRSDGFTLTSQFSDTQRTQEWTCLSDGLQALQIGGDSAAGISTQDITAEFKTVQVTGLSIPRQVTTGMQWQYALKMEGTMATPDQQQSQSSGSYSVAMQSLGKETIVVPAGTFEATKIQANSTVDVTATFSGILVPVKYNGVSMLWYVPGVGYVKSVENGDFSGTTFSITTELQSYKIP